MSTPRRRIVRPTTSTAPANNAQQQRRLQHLRTRLERERAVLARWLPRLKRAFHVVEKQLQRVARIEKRIRNEEGP